MERRRYFILDEVIPARETANMMGRVVEDIFLPMQRFAPFVAVDDKASARNPQKILPTILPEPILSTTRKQVLETVPDKELHIALTSLFGIDLARTEKETVELEGQNVRQYSLDQARDVFTFLMKDRLYAEDVQVLLNNTAHHRAYMVVGFITTSGLSLKRTSSKRTKYGFSISVPVSEIASGVLTSVLDPSIAPSISSEKSAKKDDLLPDEHIFAVAYDIIEMKRKFVPKTPFQPQKEVRYQGHRRANRKDLVMGKDSGSDEEIESDDGDDDADDDHDGQNDTNPNKGATMNAATTIDDLGPLEEVQ